MFQPCHHLSQIGGGAVAPTAAPFASATEFLCQKG